MSDFTADRDPVDRLAEHFVERLRRGEHPALTEYTERHPEHTEAIRALFPALVKLEQVKPEPHDRTGSFPNREASGDCQPVARLGDYRLLREVGRGGMGIVYEAEQVSLGRHVALKVLPGQARYNGTYLERFRREARAAAKLHHTNIVPVFGVGEADGIDFYAMQFIRGESLDKVLDDLRRLRGQSPVPAEASAAITLLRGRFAAPFDELPGTDSAATTGDGDTHPTSLTGLSPSGSNAAYFRSVARIALQIAGALAYAHRQGVLHRDIKPSNLLLDAQGIVWITDFGLSKAEGSDDLTGTGDIIGTIRYMAPERFDGHSLPQSDLYAIGLTVYELLTLRPAFAADNKAKMIEQILREAPASPRKINSQVPRDLDTIVMKCIAKDPAKRYASAEALAEDLQCHLENRPIRARRVGDLERLRAWSRRNPGLAWTGGALATLVLAVAMASTATAIFLKRTLNKSEENRLHAETAEREAKGQLWASSLIIAQSRRQSHQPGQRFESLRAIQKAMNLPLPEDRSLDELRNEALAALCLIDCEPLHGWDGNPAGCNSITPDPSFRVYARADIHGNVSIRQLADDREIAALPGTGKLNDYEGICFSPDGRFLQVKTQRGTGRLWRIDVSKPVLILDMPRDHFAFSPDSREALFTGADDSLVLIETETGKVIRQFAGAAPSTLRITWIPHRRAAVIVERLSWYVLNLDTSHAEEAVQIPQKISWSDLHPNGRILAIVQSDDFRIGLWDIETRELVRPLLEGHLTGGVVTRFNHRGDLMASSDWLSAGRLWDVGTGKQLLNRSSPGESLVFSSQDDLLGIAHAPSKTWLSRIGGGREYRSLFPEKTPLGSGFIPYLVPFHPDGRLMAVPRFRKSIVLVDAARMEHVATLPGEDQLPLCFEPSGALLTYGRSGLERWPIRASSTGYQIDAPTAIFATTSQNQWGASQNGEVIALVDNKNDAKLFRRGENLMPLGPQKHEQHDIRNLAISPDGQWVATGTHSNTEETCAKVWRAADGQWAADLPVGPLCQVVFSPDNRWLVTTGGGPRLWHVGTWAEGPALGSMATESYPTFSANSKLLALRDAAGCVRLIDVETGRDVAKLTAPGSTQLAPRSFSPDGRYLVTVGIDDQTLHVFDIAALLAGLQKLGLDNGLTAYFTNLSCKAPDPGPLHVAIFRSERK